MVTTRAKQPGVAAQAVSVHKTASALRSAADNITPSLELSNSYSLIEEPVDTIGSRLRKRRRTDSLPADEVLGTSQHVANRRSGLRKTASPVSGRASPKTRHCITETSSQDTVSASPEETKDKVADIAASRLQRVLSRQNAAPKHITPPLLPIPSPGSQLLSSDHEATLLETQNEQNTDVSSTSEMVALMMSIVDRGERIDSARGLDSDRSVMDAYGLPTWESSAYLKAQTIPILDNLATQILHRLGNSSYSEILTMVTDPDSEIGHNYNMLTSLFNHTKKVYSVEDVFLTIPTLNSEGPGAIEAVRKANLATFVSAVFGSHGVGFYHLNEYFLDTFVADGNRLLKSQAQLFLDLKTQAYISAVSRGAHSRKQILLELFPPDLEARLLSRRPGAKQLAPSEAEFIQRAQNRCKALLDEPETEAAIEALPDKYVWEDFLHDISGYVSKNFEMLVGLPAARKINRTKATNEISSDSHQQQQNEYEQKQLQTQAQTQQQVTHQSPQQELQTQQQQQQCLQHHHQRQNPLQPSVQNGTGAHPQVDTDDIAGKAARAAQFALQGFGVPNGHPMNQQMPSQPQYSPHPQYLVHAQHNGVLQQPRLPQHPGHPPHPGHAQHPVIIPPPGYQLAPGPPQHPGQHHSFQYQFQHHQSQMLPQPPPGYYLQQHHQMNVHVGGDANQHQQLYPDVHGIPYPTQTAPTQILYERARQAATAKSTPNNRRAGTPSQRRPWTTEEENALMAGLDRVKGPHWSQILAMFGAGGTINESLKDRNQVQLKDKARNLKLFFLKSGIEVPYYLQFVTGELKTRAPAQAAKSDEGGRPALPGGNEDREHIEAVLALGGMAQSGAAANATSNGPTTFANGVNGIGMNVTVDSVAEDQTPIPSIGERAANPSGIAHHTEDATSEAARMRRDSTISADDAPDETKPQVNSLHSYGRDTRYPNAGMNAVAEAAAEAARAIALMGQR
ncbi:TTAGGG repeat binding factor [Xylographa opegraphella]|nr:TTAGGG repeat binding factor [Xylographa opegraphella]